MKTVYELTPEEMQELKERYLDDHLLEVEDRSASYGELANAAETVPDWIIFDTYEHYAFSDDDFFCNEKEGTAMTIESKYLVSIERNDLIVTEVYDTLEEANGCASREWDHLTEHDKKSQSISVLYVEKTEKYFMSDDLADDQFEWSVWTNADTPEGAVKY